MIAVVWKDILLWTLPLKIAYTHQCLQCQVQLSDPYPINLTIMLSEHLLENVHSWPCGQELLSQIKFACLNSAQNSQLGNFFKDIKGRNSTPHNSILSILTEFSLFSGKWAAHFYNRVVAFEVILKYLMSYEMEFHCASNNIKILDISQYLLVLCWIFLPLPLNLNGNFFTGHCY